jgi:hypothetical protein
MRKGFLVWRASLSDDQWIEWGALPEDVWYERVKMDFGLDARTKGSLDTAAAPRMRAV